jgi:hypothetical protein
MERTKRNNSRDSRAGFCGLILILYICAPCFTRGESKFDTSTIDSALGRSGIWIQGLYGVFFPRPELKLILQRVRLASSVHAVSFITFMGSEQSSEAMGEICALPSEVTPALTKLLEGGFAVTGVHNHFLGESPHLMFIHFTGHGPAAGMARSFRAALTVTTTPLDKIAPPSVTAAPSWAKAVERVLGRQGTYSDNTLEVDVPSADFPAGPMDFWYESLLYFQPAPSGKIAAAGDVMVTARELNPVLKILLEHHFEIQGVHNHMTNEHPRVFFVHYWKIATPQDVAAGLKATLAAVHTRRN